MYGLSGSLERLHLGDLLEWLHLTRATGRLLLSAGAATRSFDIVRGKVAFASSSRAAERLASWLLRKGLAPRRALLRALAISQTRGEAFTQVAEREAGVPHQTLLEAGRSLATALVSRVLREELVAFHFDPSWPVTDRIHVDLKLECSKLMMQAAYTVDTRPPQESAAAVVGARLDPETIESMFWRIADDLDDELVDAGSFAAAHRTLMAVGELLNRWVTQGPPLLPLGPSDVTQVAARLATGQSVLLEDSPTLAWDMLSLVNGLDAPGLSRASSAVEAWAMAGDDAALLVRLLLENSRWRRERRGESDDTLRRVCAARVRAARVLHRVAGVGEDTAATAAALPVVMLELVATALTATPLASAAMQRTALRHLLPLVGRAAGIAAGLPDVLLAALTGAPADHPGAILAGLVAVAAEQSGGSVYPGALASDRLDPTVARALRSAREAAAEAADAGE
ncbi:MAG: DUF4388 domain-containing protein [Acidobacteriota bacterium]